MITNFQACICKHILIYLCKYLDHCFHKSLKRGKSLPSLPGYVTKQSYSEVPVMLELCGMWGSPSLPSVPGPLEAGVVAPDRDLSMGQIELNCEDF